MSIFIVITCACSFQFRFAFFFVFLVFIELVVQISVNEKLCTRYGVGVIFFFLSETQFMNYVIMKLGKCLTLKIIIGILIIAHKQ